MFIKIVKPKYYFIENPVGVLRKIPNLMPPYKVTVTYCQYGDTRRKPIDIWRNCETWIPRPICKNGDSCHEAAPRGSKTGTQGLGDKIERGKVPRDLCIEIMLACASSKLIATENKQSRCR